MKFTTQFRKENNPNIHSFIPIGHEMNTNIVPNRVSTP